MGFVRRSWDSVGLVLLMVIGVVSIVVVPTFGASARHFAVVGTIQLLYAIAGLAFAIWVLRLPDLPARIRRAWRMMLPTYLLWPVVLLLYAVFPGQLFPSLPDLVRLAAQVTTVIGIFAFARLPDLPADRAKLWLDAGVVAAGSAMLLWYIVLSPALASTGTTWHVIAPSIINPLIGAALLFGIGIVLLRVPDAAAARRPMLVLIASTVLTLVGDVRRSYVLNHGGPVWPTADQTTLWAAGLFFFMIAPYTQIWYARRLNEAPRGAGGTLSSATPFWPYLTVIPGYLLLMSTVGVRNPFPASGLIAGTFVVSALVLGRQMVTARENRRLAVTDRLTGLANRVRLHEYLPQALTRAAHNDTRVAVLILDMNGFKKVNDVFGHLAGDRLLVGFSELLRRCVLGSDLVVRLGGDEFAVVLPDLRDTDGPTRAVVKRITEAMTEPIDVGATVVQPNASIGVAVSLPGESSADDLLSRGDAAMYETKRGTASAER